MGAQLFKTRCKRKSNANPSLLEAMRQGNMRRRMYLENRGRCNICLPITFLLFSLLRVFWFVRLSLYFAIYAKYSPVFPLSLLTSKITPTKTLWLRTPEIRCSKTSLETSCQKCDFSQSQQAHVRGSTLKRPQLLAPCPLLINTHKQSTDQRPIL